MSGLTDADAIAFSVSDAQQDGLISLDWAAFNAVLGAIANTFMQLMLVYSSHDACRSQRGHIEDAAGRYRRDQLRRSYRNWNETGARRAV